MVEGGESAPHILESSELKGLELQTEVFLQDHGNDVIRSTGTNNT